MKNTYERAIDAHSKLTCLLPGCCFCTNFIKDEIDAAIADEREACAKIADNGMLVPPDGGSPTQDEIDTAERIASAIRART